jgi:hypothetical protein
LWVLQGAAVSHVTSVEDEAVCPISEADDTNGVGVEALDDAMLALADDDAERIRGGAANGLVTGVVKGLRPL